MWFRRGSDPLRPRRDDDRTLCGWVPLAREAEVTAWLERLNTLIQTNLDRIGSPSAEQELEAAAAAHARGSAAMLRGLGLAIPEVGTMDGLVGALARAGQDGPVDLRGETVDDDPSASKR